VNISPVKEIDKREVILWNTDSMPSVDLTVRYSYF
jgi:hypothetical protein